jgi:hypothetical protein
MFSTTSGHRFAQASAVLTARCHVICLTHHTHTTFLATFCCLQRIRSIKLADNSTTTYIGSGTAGFAEGTSLTTANLRSPTALVATGGSFYFTDTGNQLVRQAQGTTVPILAGLDPTSAPAATATLAESVLFGPTAVATGGGNVYIAGAHSCMWDQQRCKACKALRLLRSSIMMTCRCKSMHPPCDSQ